MPSNHLLHSGKSFGKSGVILPVLGFGSAPLGNLYRAMSDADAQATIDAALAGNIHYFDTAPHYGFGLSEARLGRGISGQRGRQVISTKVGRLLVPAASAASQRHGFVDAPALEPIFDYSYDAVMRSFESSLRRLQIDSVDILLAHDLGRQTHGEAHLARFREFMEGGYRAMHELRSAGRIKAIGLGANEWEVCEEAMVYGDFDGFLLAGRYTLLEQGACESFLPQCAERGVSVILGGPFNSGVLATGVSGPGPHYYNYESAPAWVIQSVNRLEAICREFNVSLPAAALQFPGAHPQVCSVIAGLASAQQVVQALQWMHEPISSAFWQRLRELGLLHPAAPVPAPVEISHE